MFDLVTLAVGAAQEVGFVEAVLVVADRGGYVNAAIS